MRKPKLITLLSVLAAFAVAPTAASAAVPAPPKACDTPDKSYNATLISGWWSAYYIPSPTHHVHACLIPRTTAGMTLTLERTPLKSGTPTDNDFLVYKSATASYVWFTPDARTYTLQLDADLPTGYIYRFGVKGSWGSFKLGLLNS
jgi:hypothetical protein